MHTSERADFVADQSQKTAQQDEAILTDIIVDRSVITQMYRPRYGAGMVIGALIVALVGIPFIIPIGLRIRLIASACFVTLATLIAWRWGIRIWRWIRAERELRSVDSACSELDPDVSALSREVVIRGQAAINPSVERLLKKLVEMRRWGTTLRVCLRDAAVPIKPFAVPFEPRTLDEADDTFEAFQAATADRIDTGGPPTLESEPDRLRRAATRRMRRNLTLAGGSVVLFMALPQIALGLAESYARRWPTWRLIMWGTFFTIALLVPRGSPIEFLRQWFITPASIVVRRFRLLSGRTQLRLFQRQNSVLCAYQLRKKEWAVLVRNETSQERRHLTRREVDCLLRAWLSPLEPPALDKLTDLQ